MTILANEIEMGILILVHILSKLLELVSPVNDRMYMLHIAFFSVKHTNDGIILSIVYRMVQVSKFQIQKKNSWNWNSMFVRGCIYWSQNTKNLQADHLLDCFVTNVQT